MKNVLITMRIGGIHCLGLVVVQHSEGAANLERVGGLVKGHVRLDNLNRPNRTAITIQNFDRDRRGSDDVIVVDLSQLGQVQDPGLWADRGAGQGSSHLVRLVCSHELVGVSAAKSGPKATCLGGSLFHWCQLRMRLNLGTKEVLSQLLLSSLKIG